MHAFKFAHLPFSGEQDASSASSSAAANGLPLQNSGIPVLCPASELTATQPGSLTIPSPALASVGNHPVFPPLPPHVLQSSAVSNRFSLRPRSFQRASTFDNLRWDKDKPTLTVTLQSTAPATAASTANVSVKPVLQGSSSSWTKKPKALYMFAGIKRHSDVAHFLTQLGWEIFELDIILSRKHDLSQKKVQALWKSKIEANAFQALVVSPPCDTFTRVQFSNLLGPAPLRCFNEPRGYSWLVGARWTKANLGNILSDFALEMVLIQISLDPGLLFMEFPEDLGTIRNGINRGLRPASLWQWPLLETIRQSQNVNEAGILQSDYGADYLKPTRIMFKGRLEEGAHYPGPPQFDELGHYIGPIPQFSAASLGLRTLARTSSDTCFRTSGTAAWPSLLCKLAAKHLNTGWLAFLARLPLGKSFADFPMAASDFVEEGSTPAASVPPFVTFLPQSGFWVGGHGTPRQTYVLGKVKPFHDGAGLTSAGRWAAKDRQYPSGRRWDSLREDIYKLLTGHKTDDGKAWGSEGLQRALLQFCVTPKTAVFPEDLVLKGRDILKAWIKTQCSDFPTQEEDVTEGQPFTLSIIFHLLREMRDPDYGVFAEFKTGVTAGIASPLPRNPALFEEQTTWRLPEVFSDVSDAENYGSLEEHKDAVRKLFMEERAEGMMDFATPEVFFEKFKGRATVSSMAAILEKGGTKLRVLHDGTHTVHLNNRIRCRDKLRSPGVAEKHTQFRQRRADGQIVLSLLLDVSKAHRRVKIMGSEQGYLGCRLDNEHIWWNLVGTFGISSAAYWWARLIGGVIRLLHGLLGARWPLELLTYADAVEATAGNAQEREGITLVIFILLTLGVPMKLSKFRGGFQVEWVGLAIDNRLYSLGLSLSRATWVINWISEVVNSKSVETSNFAGGLGRLNFAAAALLYERPWLGPLYSWSSTIQLSGVHSASVPWGVKFILFWLAKRLSGKARLMVTPSLPTDFGFLFKCDAKAEDGRATIGGWECLNNCPPGKAR